MNVDAERYPALAARAMNTEEAMLGVHVDPEMVSELDDLDEFTRRVTNDLSPLVISHGAQLVIRPMHAITPRPLMLGRARAKRRA